MVVFLVDNSHQENFSVYKLIAVFWHKTFIITIKLNKIYSSLKAKLSNLIMPGDKAKSFLKSESFSLYITILVVFFIFVFKGSLSDGQDGLFGNLVKQYTEETSASVENYIQTDEQLADIGSLAAYNNQNSNLGDQEDNSLLASDIDDGSVAAYNPVLQNYIEVGAFKRNQIAEYTVQPGDLLSFIASDYGVSVNSIIWANKLKDSDSISPGQVLKIPPVSGVIHEVKDGDTIASIAKKYNASEERIRDFNALSEDGQLQLGDELIVPDGEIKRVYIGSKSAIPQYGTTKVIANKRFAYLPDLGDYYMIPTTGYDWGRIHGRNGVDMANACGTPIYAAADGAVAIADSTGWNGGFGKFIKLIHSNGTETLYGHATKLLISQGESVARGQLIALMGTTGRSTGCHLHFEVHGARNPLAKY